MNYYPKATKEEFLNPNDYKEYRKKIMRMKEIREAKDELSRRTHPAQMKLVKK